MGLLLLDDQEYHVHNGDCIEQMAVMPAASVDFSVYSPPFPSLFSYTSEGCDIGNSEDLRGEAKLHLAFFFKQIRRVMKPGRVMVVHLCQIPPLARNGELDTTDFRGMIIRLGKRAGFHYQYDWLVSKNPQAQAIRTHSHRLLFVSLERDRAISCGAFGDYLVKFITPGENQVPIDSPGISRNDWIKWANCSWDDIRETETLNAKGTKGEDDVKHIAPLQLGVIERLVKLYSNPGEIVFSPFTGIGSEGFVSLKLGRRFYGCELKKEYHESALKNIDRAIRQRKSEELTLF